MELPRQPLKLVPYPVDKPVYFADILVAGYQDDTEPKLYPEKYSKFYHESVMNEQINKHRNMAETLAMTLSHALALGHLGSGSTQAMALDALEEYVSLYPEEGETIITRKDLDIINTQYMGQETIKEDKDACPK